MKNVPARPLAFDKLNSFLWTRFELLVGSDLTEAAPACCPRSHQTRAVGGQQVAVVPSPLG